jgi:hypothetical protein
MFVAQEGAQTKSPETRAFLYSFYVAINVQAIALMAADRRLLWRAALFL